MVTARSEVTARFEFLAVMLADPDLLDLAFAEVIASWEAEPPRPPNRTLVDTSAGQHPRPRIREVDGNGQGWRAWLWAVPDPAWPGRLRSGR